MSGPYRVFAQALGASALQFRPASHCETTPGLTVGVSAASQSPQSHAEMKAKVGTTDNGHPPLHGALRPPDGCEMQYVRKPSTDTRGNVMKVTHWALALLLSSISVTALAQEDALPWEEYGKLIDSKKSVATLGPTLFGDQASLVDGALSFSQTDVSLPGNSGLPVAFTRTLTVENSIGRVNGAPLADWAIDLPNISGVFATTWPDHRCSAANKGQAMPPVITEGLATYLPEDYWQGISASMPGGGIMLLANSTTVQPSTGGPYYWLTKDLTYFSCLPSIQNASGEGFQAITSAGVKYTFAWLAHFSEPRLKDDKIANNFLSRSRNVLYVTRIEDRFGNYVDYNYNPVSTGVQLASIAANDGRQISLAYNEHGHVASVSDGTHTWQYKYIYDTTFLKGSLSEVILPDNSQWTLDFGDLSSARFGFDRSRESDDPLRFCEAVPEFNQNTPESFIGTITHPSGAIGKFTVSREYHGRTNVPHQCVNYADVPGNSQQDDYMMYPYEYANLALTQKEISGPGLPSAASSRWTYGYASTGSYVTARCTAPTDCRPPTCTDDSCAGNSLTIVNNPDGTWNRYTHGNSYRYNEGLLLKVETGSGATALSSETKSYDLAQSGQPYPTPIGESVQPRDDGFTSEYLRPLRSNVTSQDGATFSWQVDNTCALGNCFDALARPTKVTKSSSLGYSKPETTVYADFPSLWVMGQVASVTEAGKVVRQTTFNGMGLPFQRFRFGALRQTLAYNADGTVASVGDGNNHTTLLGGWMRGIPQSITFADLKTRSAAVNGLGEITSTTDELGTTTSYTYDVMGRLASLSIPGWTPSNFSFVQVPSLEFGLTADHWRHTETTGTYKKSTYFDARFRPLLTLEEDTANAASKRYTRRAFDYDNRETFVSYPAANDPGLGAGTSTSYDALGRVTASSQTSELGVLSTTNAYLAGFQSRTTNPNGQSTTASFQAFDTPDSSAPVSIVGPGGVTTSITRDAFGMPTSVTRSGLYDGNTVSATRTYIYDGFERLCKRIEPESGATLFAYDGQGNLTASAEGTSFTSAGCTSPASAPASLVTRSYDARDRLLSVNPANAPTTLYSYASDGALSALVQGDSAWSYSYNNRRLLTSETLNFGDTYSFDYGYTSLGHLSGIATPSGLSIDYAPNALGQPTRAGSFASGAQYFPDGSLKQFTYGNGLVRTVTQNVRHLPWKVRDALGSNVVHDFTYTYDGNGNVKGITDADQAGLQTRTLGYDARDRLVSASGVWGVAGYAYDPLDNLRVADQGARQFRYNYDVNNRLSTLTDPVGTQLSDFAYDSLGRQIRRDNQIRTFDGANRITAIGGETYAYDGAGRRIATWGADGSTKVEVYTQGGQLAFAVDSKKGGGSSFVYLAGQRVAEDHWTCPDTHAVTYLHSDVLGSPVATTDASGAVLERTYYAPYGEALNRTVDGPGYTGHVQDAATGLVYAQQRYYDPVDGKFLSVDPVPANPNTGDNFNRYWYANNNPYRFTDPTGRSALFKLAKFAIKGGDVAQTVAGVVEDANTVTDSSASLGDRVLAGVSLATEALPISVGDVKDVAKGIRAIAGKGDVAGDAAKLEKKLASEEQLGELASGGGTPIAGAGTDTELRAADRLANDHGGSPGDFQKVTSSVRTTSDGGHVETHAIRNVNTGEIVEPKTIVNPTQR